MNKAPINVAFDIDDTLYKISKYKEDGKNRFLQVPDYPLVGVLRWFHNNGDNIYVWSAGGVLYAEQIVVKLGLSEWVTKVIPKDTASRDFYGIDIAFDDADPNMGKVNVKINRPDYESDEWKNQ
ncbi:MAG TPA: hypothetical protein VN922_05700 [Bacteroidia bacterium]|nr:hypothetical protein [Bacteroidia bacterium]